VSEVLKGRDLVRAGPRQDDEAEMLLKR